MSDVITLVLNNDSNSTYVIANNDDLSKVIDHIKGNHISKIFINDILLNSNIYLTIYNECGIMLGPSLSVNKILDYEELIKSFHIFDDNKIVDKLYSDLDIANDYTDVIVTKISDIVNSVNSSLLYGYLVYNLKKADVNARYLDMAYRDTGIAELLYLGMSKELIPYLISVKGRHCVNEDSEIFLYNTNINFRELLLSIFNVSELPYVTETEVTFYCDIISWLGIPNQQYSNMDWEHFINNGSPLDDKILALGLLFHNNDWWCNYSIPIGWKSRDQIWNTSFIFSNTNRLSVCYYDAYVYAARNTVSNLNMVNKKFRLALNNPNVINFFPMVFLHSQGLLKFYERRNDKYHINVSYISTLVKKLYSVRNHIKPKGLLIPPHLSFTEITNILIASCYFGKNAVLVNKYALEHLPEYYYNPNFVIPDKYTKEVGKSYSAFTWIFDLKLKVTWDKSSARLCIIHSIMNEYDVSFTIASHFYSNPSSNKALDYNSKHPPVTNCNLPKLQFKHNDIIMEILAKDDIINLVIGTYTSCCQHLDGAASKLCTESWTDVNSANYVFKRNNKIIAHMWCWLDKTGILVIDSIEGLENTPVESVANIVTQFAKTYQNDLYVSGTNYGLTNDVVNLLNVTKEIVPEPIIDYSYMDASPGSECYWIIPE